MSKLEVNGHAVELELKGEACCTAASIARAINKQVSGVQAHATALGGVSVGNRVIVHITSRTIPRHVAAAAKKAGLPAEVGGAYGEVPLWLGVLLDGVGRMGAHPGRYRARLYLIAVNQVALRAAWRLGGAAAVREAYLALGGVRVACA